MGWEAFWVSLNAFQLDRAIQTESSHSSKINISPGVVPGSRVGLSESYPGFPLSVSQS